MDPRGLLTPFWDSGSVDAWLAAEDGRRLIPSRTFAAEQRLDLSAGVAVLSMPKEKNTGTSPDSSPGCGRGVSPPTLGIPVRPGQRHPASAPVGLDQKRLIDIVPSNPEPIGRAPQV